MKSLKEFKSWVKNLRVAVLGAGISNRPLIRLLLEAGAETVIFDMREVEEFTSFKEEISEYNNQPQWSLGKDYLIALQGFDLIFRTPIVRPDLPELIAERERGAIISSEMEVFFALCPAEIIAITGSDGKTTTSTLTALALEAAGYTTYLGGNIGKPLLSQVDEIKETDKVVVELSSFQLGSMRQSPEVAVITNISPNHLDVHKDYEEYINCKAEIFRHQNFNNRLILNGADSVLQNFAREARGEVIWTGERPFGEGKLFGLEANNLFYQASPQAEKEHILYADEITLPGYFNCLNILSALAAGSHLFDIKEVAKHLAKFKGVEHRQEFVRELDGVRYYNSSIDSSPSRSQVTISAFSQFSKPLYLICGGKDKNLIYDDLVKTWQCPVEKVFVCGDNADKIKAAYEKFVAGQTVSSPCSLEGTTVRQVGVGLKLAKLLECSSYEEALQQIRREAEPGSLVLFTPAGTSFDRFNNFAERGRIFKDLVRDLV